MMTKPDSNKIQTFISELKWDCMMTPNNKTKRTINNVKQKVKMKIKKIKLSRKKIIYNPTAYKSIE